ncbi:PIN domain nuclease [Agromyces sp. NPDC058484]|uniref:type II toxin-antitoxin system VapC family toxin n=1 Tax=Agromyces sp. NPDC058484 TaxID=3346524 RepID=UPI00365A1248
MLVDTSAWIEFLRATGSVTHVAVRNRIGEDARLVTCDPVIMAVLAGGRSEEHVVELRGLLARAELVPTMPTDWDDAARIYRAGRRRGVTIRKLVDCLIAAIALRVGAPVLHNDADFDALAQVVPLTVSRG